MPWCLPVSYSIFGKSALQLPGVFVFGKIESSKNLIHLGECGLIADVENFINISRIERAVFVQRSRCEEKITFLKL